MNNIYIVQTNCGYYINGVSYHSTQEGAEVVCAYAMNECLNNGEGWFEASKYEIVTATLEV